MPKTHIRITTLLLGALPSTVAGCAAAPDGGEFREAIPEARSVALAGPVTEEGTTAGTSAVASEESWMNGDWAWSYEFTRTVRDGVNELTGQILGTVWLVVHTRPTTIDPDEATWGPYADALDPVEWRLRVTKVGEGEFDYVLEGRPKRGADGYQPVLSGTGYGRDRQEHGDGRFVINVDRWKALEPMKAGEDAGRIVVIHDLPRTISEDLSLGDRLVTADVRSSGPVYFRATSLQREDGSGRVLVDARDDADGSESTALEDIQILSQYSATGAGRSDYTIASGDIPAELGALTAVECWGADFARTYYADSLEVAATEGAPEVCAFSGPAELSHLE